MKKYILLLLLVGCASSPGSSAKIDFAKPLMSTPAEKTRAMMMGRWLGEADTKDGKHSKWLMERRLDGSYTVKFQLFQASKKVLEQIEVGVWGISAGIYFTMTREMIEGMESRPVDTTLATYYDAYDVLSLDDSTFRYRSRESGDVFTVKKVADSFRLP